MSIQMSAAETKVFDPRDPSTGSNGDELPDPSVAFRDDRWRMFLAGQSQSDGSTDIFEASLPAASPLTPSGWVLTRKETGALEPLAGRQFSQWWDGKGGRHCPSYVRGWDPEKQAHVERIYYAGAAENLGGPYAIGFLEWDGERWADQPEPAFVATEEWEHGSVYEPNLIWHDGKWKMWYVAGSNRDDYIVQGYAESASGRSDWTERQIFAPAEMKMFDFCVRQCGDRFDAVFARVCLSGGAIPAETGLWWCSASLPSGRLSGWSEPVQIMTAADRGWHSGPWKPSFEVADNDPGRATVFFDGVYRTEDPGPFPFAFTVGCLQTDLPLKT